MAASETIANLSRGSYSVDITFEKLEHTYDKQLAILPVPKTLDPNNESPVAGTDNPLNFNIDIQKCKQVITITGFLLEETGNTALTKKDNIESLMSTPGNISLIWKVGGTQVAKNGNIIKCTITEIAGRIGDENPSALGKHMAIMLQFSVGQHRG